MWRGSNPARAACAPPWRFRDYWRRLTDDMFRGVYHGQRQQPGTWGSPPATQSRPPRGKTPPPPRATLRGRAGARQRRHHGRCRGRAAARSRGVGRRRRSSPTCLPPAAPRAPRSEMAIQSVRRGAARRGGACLFSTVGCPTRCQCVPRGARARGLGGERSDAPLWRPGVRSGARRVSPAPAGLLPAPRQVRWSPWASAA